MDPINKDSVILDLLDFKINTLKTELFKQIELIKIDNENIKQKLHLINLQMIKLLE